jgi:hypothetical protein
LVAKPPFSDTPGLTTNGKKSRIGSEVSTAEYRPLGVGPGVRKRAER